MTDQRREPYEPPTVEHVRFAPTEIAAAACKRRPGPPPFGNACERAPGQYQSVGFGS